MSSRNKEMQARTEGMAYALKIAGQGGIEELEKEIEIIKAGGKLNYTKNQVDQAIERI